MNQPKMTPRRMAIMERMKVHTDKLRKRMKGKNIIHLTCGWTGDKLSREGTCPKCGENLGE